VSTGILIVIQHREAAEMQGSDPVEGKRRPAFQYLARLLWGEARLNLGTQKVLQRFSMPLTDGRNDGRAARIHGCVPPGRSDRPRS
jgi:hypothetical protein